MCAELPKEVTLARDANALVEAKAIAITNSCFIVVSLSLNRFVIKTLIWFKLYKTMVLRS